MTPAEYVEQLEAACTEVRAEALEMGHDLHPWSRREFYERYTACRDCGARVNVLLKTGQPVITGSAHISGCPG